MTLTKITRSVTFNLNIRSRFYVGMTDMEKEEISDRVPMNYADEWTHLFGKDSSFSHLRQLGLRGDLRNCKFRSVCWRLYLRCFPQTRLEEWVSTVRTSRQYYQQLKDKYIIDPRDKTQGLDLALDNPLSQEDQSPWHTFFRDEELKQQISQDVRRTFPEVEFFHSKDVRKILNHVLFVYAKEYPDISYRQGMHELLAPFIFVLACDHEAAAQTESLGLLRPAVGELLDPNYLEHDSYSMLIRVLDSMGSWYYVMDYSPSRDKQDLTDAEPFQKPQDSSYSEVVNKLNKIDNELLKTVDRALYTRLHELEIAPQLYGIRYLRLLFGREFLMEDLLVVWDALFADSPDLQLADYVLVALLVKIRGILLRGDYTDCLKALMHYPAGIDVTAVVELAVNMKNPPPPSSDVIRPPPPTHPVFEKKPSGIHTLRKKFRLRSTSKEGSPSDEETPKTEPSSVVNSTGTRKKHLSDSAKEMQPVTRRPRRPSSLSPQEADSPLARVKLGKALRGQCEQVEKHVEELGATAQHNIHTHLSLIRQIACELEGTSLGPRSSQDHSFGIDALEFQENLSDSR